MTIDSFYHHQVSELRFVACTRQFTHVRMSCIMNLAAMKRWMRFEVFLSAQHAFELNRVHARLGAKNLSDFRSKSLDLLALFRSRGFHAPHLGLDLLWPGEQVILLLWWNPPLNGASVLQRFLRGDVRLRISYSMRGEPSTYHRNCSIGHSANTPMRLVLVRAPWLILVSGRVCHYIVPLLNVVRHDLRQVF